MKSLGFFTIFIICFQAHAIIGSLDHNQLPDQSCRISYQQDNKIKFLQSGTLIDDSLILTAKHGVDYEGIGDKLGFDNVNYTNNSFNKVVNNEVQLIVECGIESRYVNSVVYDPNSDLAILKIDSSFSVNSLEIIQDENQFRRISTNHCYAFGYGQDRNTEVGNHNGMKLFRILNKDEFFQWGFGVLHGDSGGLLACEDISGKLVVLGIIYGNNSFNSRATSLLYNKEWLQTHLNN